MWRVGVDVFRSSVMVILSDSSFKKMKDDVVREMIEWERDQDLFIQAHSGYVYPE
jgi:hypothetical protein